MSSWTFVPLLQARRGGLRKDEDASKATFKQKCVQYKHQVKQAFLDAYELRLTLAKSVMKYTFRFPNMGQSYDPVSMKAANVVNGQHSQEETVYACLSPAVFTQDRKGSTDRMVAVPALVLLQGHPMHCPITSL